jgi:peroxiredoxin
MLNCSRRLLGFALAFAMVATAHAVVTPGQPAPDFTLTGIDGKSVRLSDFRGKYVVLEWFNAECPFVQKHYESGNMQGLQSRYLAKGVVWLGINSTSPKHSNYRDPARSAGILADWKSQPTAFVLDPGGEVGRKYGARTTPHMYIVGPKGELVYAGGIDDKPSTSPRDIPNSRNHVAADCRQMTTVFRRRDARRRRTQFALRSLRP